MDFEIGNSLGSDGVLPLCEILKTNINTSLQSLNFKSKKYLVWNLNFTFTSFLGNVLGNEGAIALSNMLKTNTSIQSLDLKSNTTIKSI